MVQVHPGPPFTYVSGRSVNTRLFSLFPFLGSRYKNPFADYLPTFRAIGDRCFPGHSESALCLSKGFDLPNLSDPLSWYLSYFGEPVAGIWNCRDDFGLDRLTLGFNGCFGLSLQPLTQSLLCYQSTTSHSDCGQIFLLNRIIEEPKRKARHFGSFARSIRHPR